MAKPDAVDLQPFFAALEARDRLSDAERQALLDAAGDKRSYRAGADLVKQGDRATISTLVLSGMTARYSTVEDGGRQITGLHIAGDFVDLHSFPLKLMDHSVAAISDTITVAYPHAGLLRITETMPHLTRLLWLVTLLDGAIHRQWMVAKGRLTADEHMANFFCEQFTRARIAGLIDGGRFSLPLTQTQLGDALGLSIVHTNRTLQRLRRIGAVDWQDGVVEVRDWDTLSDLGQFDPTYLHLEKLPR